MGQLIWKKLTGEKGRRIVGAILFLVIAARLFMSVTYLFRNTGVDRINVVGIKEEQNLDVVYIGGSALYAYWQPLKAWSDYGYTSYNLGTSGVLAEALEYYVRYALKYQKPDLIVMDARPFCYYGAEYGVEPWIRNSVDSMDFFSLDRIALAKRFGDYRADEIDFPMLALYIDIFAYHARPANLGDPEAWQLIRNTGSSPDKGYAGYQGVVPCDQTEFETDERIELPGDGKSMELLISLLDYLREEDLNVLFVVTPAQTDTSEQAKYNTIMDTVNAYGYGFLNINEYYEEIGIDFAKDFQDPAHVNCLGAEKVTAFLEDYLEEHYDLPDHRGETGYEDWNLQAIRFAEEEEERRAIIR